MNKLLAVCMGLLDIVADLSEYILRNSADKARAKEFVNGVIAARVLACANMAEEYMWEQEKALDMGNQALTIPLKANPSRDVM